MYNQKKTLFLNYQDNHCKTFTLSCHFKTDDYIVLKVTQIISNCKVRLNPEIRKVTLIVPGLSYKFSLSNYIKIDGQKIGV